MGGEGGWFEYTNQMSLEELHQRQIENEAFLADLDGQIERARIAEFGQVVEPVAESVRMPLSGYLFEWRTDGFYRASEPDGPDAEPGDGVSDWTPWNVDRSVEGIREAADAALTSEPWRLHFGCTYPDAQVAVRRQDSVAVAIVRLGGLWIAEWRGPAQPATVTVGADVIRIG